MSSPVHGGAHGFRFGSTAVDPAGAGYADAAGLREEARCTASAWP